MLNEDNSHEISSPVFWKNNTDLLFAYFAIRSGMVNCDVMSPVVEKINFVLIALFCSVFINNSFCNHSICRLKRRRKKNTC